MELNKALQPMEANKHMIDYFTQQLEMLCFSNSASELKLNEHKLQNLHLEENIQGTILHIQAQKDKDGLLRYVAATVLIDPCFLTR